MVYAQLDMWKTNALWGQVICKIQFGLSELVGQDRFASLFKG
jgi:hypothetical protein